MELKFSGVLRAVIFCTVLIYSFTSAQAASFIASSFSLKNCNAFIENKGQLRNSNGEALNNVKFYLDDKNVNVLCYADKIVFQFQEAITYTQKAMPEAFNPKDHSSDSTIINASLIEMCFVGANPSAVIYSSGQEPTSLYFHLLSDKEITASLYKKVVYHNIYPGIDLILETTAKGVEYSFIVQPGGDPNQIKIKWNGANITPDRKNISIRYSNEQGYITEKDLKCRQSKEVVPCNYSIQDNIIAFKLDKYDTRLPLIIDPKLDWGTYFGGGNAGDLCYGVSEDDSGYIYITGSTTATTAIATSGAYKTSLSGNLDAYVAKFSSDGKLIWGSYFGGSGQDVSVDIVLSDSGTLYITGYTQSNSGIATSGALKTSYSSLDAFLAKFSTMGHLIWGTYYGGNNQDFGKGVGVDKKGNPLITGSTYSTSGIATSSAYQTSFVSGGSTSTSMYIAKFSSSGNLRWSTYFGSNTTDAGEAITADDSNNIYVAGSSNSIYGLGTSGSFRSFSAGKDDAVLAKFSPSGSLTWATYYGGSNYDEATDIAVDTSNNIILLGKTVSSSLIASSGAFQTFNKGPSGEAFVAKFSNSGSRLWCTYYGGTGYDWPLSVTTNKKNDIFFTGITQSTDLPVPGGFQRTLGGNSSIFISKFSPAGNLNYGTYYGGNSLTYNYGVAIAADTFSNIYVGGETTSSSNIATSGSYQTSYTGSSSGCSGFLLRLRALKTDAGINKIVKPVGKLCPGSNSIVAELRNFGETELDSVKIDWTVNNKSQSRYKWSGQLKPDSSAEIILGTYLFNTGTDTIRAWTANPNGLTDSIPQNDSAFVIDTVNSLPKVNAGGNHAVCPGISVTLGSSKTAGHTYSWTSVPPGFTSNIYNPKVSPTVTTIYYLTETITATGCSNTDSSIVTVITPPAATTGSGRRICYGASTTLGASAVSGNTYYWSSIPAGFTSTSSSITVSPTVTTLYYLNVYSTVTGCSNQDTVRIIVDSLPVAKVGAGHTICKGAYTIIGATAVPRHTYSWTSKPSGFISSSSEPVINPQVTTTYYLTETDTIHGCSHSDSVIIRVNPLPGAYIGNSHSICYGDTLKFGTAPKSNHVYLWSSDPSGLTSTSSSVTVVPSSATVFYLRETDTLTGCVNSDSVVINVNPLPSPKAGFSQTICSGQSAAIGSTATPGHSYSWTSKPSGFTSGSSKAVVSPSVTTKYYLTETITTTGCSKTDSVTITVNPLPAANAGGKQSICKGDSVKIGATAVSGSSYAWTSRPLGFTSASSNPIVKPDTTTVYYLKETNTSTGCSRTDSVAVTVSPLPKAATGPDKIICFGSSATIGASAISGHTYSWTSRPKGFTSTSSIITVNPVTTTTYYLTENNTSTGCSKTDSVTVTVNPLPAAKAGANQSICLGQSTSIGDGAVSGNSYAWTSKPVGFSSNKSNPAVYPVVTTTYYLTETVNATGCSKTDSVTVTVNTLPVADAGKDTFMCESGSVNIGSMTKPAGLTYSWWSDPAGFSSSSSSVTVSPSVSTTYILVVRNSNGCSDTDSVLVTVNPLPVPYAGQSQTICKGDSVSIGSKALKGYTYQWTSKPVGFSADIPAPVIKPMVTTTYYLTETNGYGCSKSDSVTITVNQRPLAKTSGDKTICQGDNIAIGADAVPGNSYSWTSNSGFTSNSSNPVVSPDTKTRYILTETTPAGCSKTDSVTITVNPIPQKPFAGNDQKICSEDTAILTFSPAADMQYNWTSDPASFTSTDGIIHVHPSVTTDYILTATSKATGCNNADTVRVTVIPLPQPKISGQKSFCGIDTATYSTPKHDSSTYFWTVRNGKILSGQFTSKVNVQWSDTGTANIIVKETNSNGCIKKDPILLSIHTKPVAHFTPYQSCAGNSVQFLDSLIKYLSYTWDFGDGTILKDQMPVHAYSKAGTYRMKETVQNAAGCQDTVSHLIIINPVPDVHIAIEHDTGRTYHFAVSDTSYAAYTWSFGDGDSSSEKFPVHTFTKSLPDKVKLLVDNQYHCRQVIDSTLDITYLTDKDSISIFPNPFSSDIHIYERLKGNTNLKLYIYDMLGHKILDNVSWNREPGIYTELFDEYGLAQAMYLVKLVINDKEVIYKKMIKIYK
jgi:hypothetical protein